MSQLIQPGVFLRHVLKADGLLSAATAVAFTAGAVPLAQATGLPQTVLLATGFALVPWVAFLLWVATRPALPSGAVWAVIVLNLAWVVDCALVAFGVLFEATALGVALAAFQVVGTLLLAELEYIGLRRSGPALAS